VFISSLPKISETWLRTLFSHILSDLVKLERGSADYLGKFVVSEIERLPRQSQGRGSAAE
jgi:hypothetical protein